MADRIVVLSANPGRVRTVVENGLPRPRDYRSPEFLELMDRLHGIIVGHEMPDVPAAPRAVETLPEASTSEIVGLLEFLDARGGRGDVFRIAADTNREFGRVITVVKAAEILDFVDTPREAVILTETGRRFVRAAPEARKAVWREQILKLKIFRDVRDLIEKQERREVDALLVEEMLILRAPYENYEKIFDTLVRWGRFGNLFAYDEGSEKLSLQERSS